MGFNGHTVVDMDSHFREYVDVDRTYRELAKIKILGANALRLCPRLAARV